MTRDEYQNLFNILVKDIAQLLEVSGNDNLVRIVKKKLYDFSDKLQGERDYGLDKDSSRFNN